MTFVHNSKVSIHKGLLQSSMNATRAAPKKLLLIGGLDPSGGAGLLADIQTVAAAGEQSKALCTLLTAQSLSQWTDAWPVAPQTLRTQIQSLRQDPAPAAIKIGALGGEAQAELVADLLQHWRQETPQLPVILDPVLRSSSGGALGDLPAVQKLLPLRPWLCPNQAEAHLLSGLVGSDACWQLITDAPGGAQLRGPEGQQSDYAYERLPAEWRGTGCTLASLWAVAAARGLDASSAAAWALAALQSWLHASAPPCIHREPLP